MNSVGIDVSKGKSMVSVLRPFGEVVISPFEVEHTTESLDKLVEKLRELEGETRIIMEYTSSYYQPIAKYLHDARFFVSVVHALRVHDYGNDSIRRVKTDKKDALKIAHYGLDRWISLVEYIPDDEQRQTLKLYNRQYNEYMKVKVSLKNNLVSILDQTFLEAKGLFTSAPRKDGHEKWVDFAERFWHCGCITKYSEKKFTEQYQKWCKNEHYNFNAESAKNIYLHASASIATLPCNAATQRLVTDAVHQVNCIAETLAGIIYEMQLLASKLPEYSVVMSMSGIGEKLGPRLMAEIGDIQRFTRKEALVAYAGVDAPPFQSGNYEARSRRISKRGSPWLRKTLFEVMICLLQHPSNDAVYLYMQRKKAEGKPYLVYMMAGTNKFLRIYFARVRDCLNNK